MKNATLKNIKDIKQHEENSKDEKLYLEKDILIILLQPVKQACKT